LEYVPKASVRESQKQRRLRTHLKRFYSETPVLRERSFYVDFKAGHWQWGNPELEKLNIVSFIIKELRLDCDYIEAQLKLVRVLWQKIRRYGRHDDRTQNFMKKHYGTTTQDIVSPKS
jgi:hypothetical protein